MQLQRAGMPSTRCRIVFIHTPASFNERRRDRIIGWCPCTYVCSRIARATIVCQLWQMELGFRAGTTCARGAFSIIAQRRSAHFLPALLISLGKYCEPRPCTVFALWIAGGCAVPLFTKLSWIFRIVADNEIAFLLGKCIFRRLHFNTWIHGEIIWNNISLIKKCVYAMLRLWNKQCTIMLGLKSLLLNVEMIYANMSCNYEIWFNILHKNIFIIFSLIIHFVHFIIPEPKR